MFNYLSIRRVVVLIFRVMKSWLPERIKGPVRAALGPRSDIGLEHFEGRKKVIIGLAGFYQNLGDMALTYAQKRFIESTLPDYDVLLFPSTDTYRRMKALRSVCKPGDIITTIAGGNMDDVYVSLEDARRYVVRSFRNFPVISFPQTMAFSNTPAGRKRLKRSAKTYARHSELTIFGREPESLSKMKSSFPGTPVQYCPDIVLSLQLDNPGTLRSGIFVCLRDDKEAKLSHSQRAGISTALLAGNEDVRFGDTVDVSLDECTPETYEATLESYWDMLRHCSVVVTDRLHCMIFCAITKTPCVVLSNSNHKIEGVYRAWLDDLAFITYIDTFDIEEILGAVSHLKSLDLSDVLEMDMSNYFESLRESLLTAAGRAPV